MYAKITDHNAQLRHPQQYAAIVAKHGPISQWGYDFFLGFTDSPPVPGIAPPVALSDQREKEFWERYQKNMYGARLAAITSKNKMVYADINLHDLIGDVNLWPLELVGPDPNVINQERATWPVVWMFDAKNQEFPGWSAWHVAMVGTTTYRNKPTQMVAQLVRGTDSRALLELPSDPKVLVHGGAALDLTFFTTGVLTPVQKELDKHYPASATHIHFIYPSTNDVAVGRSVKGWTTYGPGTPEMDAWVARHCSQHHLNIGVLDIHGQETFDANHRFHGVGQFGGTDAERNLLAELKDNASQKAPAVMNGLDLANLFQQAQDPNLINNQALYRQVLPLVARGMDVEDAIVSLSPKPVSKAPKF